MQIEINSEDDAWRVLEDLLSGAQTLDDVNDIIFGNWVRTTVYVPENRYDSALNTYMMQGWQDAQRALYRSYAITAKGANDARSLSEFEKEKLELVVKVSSGSSDQQADLLDILKEAVLSAVENMEPHQIAIVLIVAVLTWAGQSVTKHWISKKSEEKLAEIDAGKQSEQNKLISEAFKSIQSVSNDAQKMQLIAQAKRTVPDAAPILATMEEEAEVARYSLVKHAGQNDSMINGVNIPAVVAQKLTRETRTLS